MLVKLPSRTPLRPCTTTYKNNKRVSTCCWIGRAQYLTLTKRTAQRATNRKGLQHDIADSVIERAVHKIYNVQNDLPPERVFPSKVTEVSRIYPTSRDLNLSEMEALGFDYDYTIANYKDNLQTLIYNLAVQYLVDELYYPKEIASTFEYDPNFAIRGLYYDYKNGNLLKLDYLYNITPGYVYFGREPLSTDEILKQYGGFHISAAYQTNLRPLIDRFCLPEACLIADMIEYCKKTGVSFDPSYVYKDVNKAVDHIHRSGRLHAEIMKNIPKYLEKTTFLEPFFSRFRKAGKKIFLLTNSPFKFVDAGMRHLMSDNWRDFFDVVIVQAGKPDWFGSRRPFRQLDVETGRVLWDRVETVLEPGKVYVEGNLSEFNRLLKWNGSNVAYFGDHLLADVREPSRESGWRTGIVIEELEHEVRIQNSQTYKSTISKLLVMEDLARRLKILSDDPEALQLQEALKSEIAEKRRIAKQMFNRNFGSVFRTHTNPTLFAYILQRYADIYTSKLENFEFYPLDFVHRAEREFLPHEKPVQRHVMKQFERLGLSDHAILMSDRLQQTD